MSNRGLKRRHRGIILSFICRWLSPNISPWLSGVIESSQIPSSQLLSRISPHLITIRYSSAGRKVIRGLRFHLRLGEFSEYRTLEDCHGGDDLGVTVKFSSRGPE